MMIFHSTATALVVLLLVACNPSTPDASTESGTPTRANTALLSQEPTQTPGPAEAAREQGVHTYRRMWASFATAGMTADWQSPELALYATGTALSTLTQALFGYSQRGILTRGQPVLTPTVASVEPEESPAKVVVTDCGDSTNWTEHYADTGQPVDDKPDTRRRINAVVDKQADGSWKVSDFGVHEVETC
ncbi:hypothetical protein [Saccharothrix lopnurensis]|uniref:Mce-associated membrane protein n=1 Tax=Saccharothrix lopnurensis TaxID=1670621 RepID=A0ABW1P8B1_9PSEU